MAIAHIQYGQLLRRRWGFVAIITLLVLGLTLGITVLQPFEYKSSVNILVIQKSAVGIDAYSASKSAERIAMNLGQIIYSSTFFSQVLRAGVPIDQTYFAADEDKRRTQWQDMVTTDVPANTTILQIAVYHTDRTQATNIAKAIAEILPTKAIEYIGLSDIEFKVVDEPLTSSYPVRPNFLINGVVGLFIGLFISFLSLLLGYTESTVPPGLYHRPTGPAVPPTKLAVAHQPGPVGSLNPHVPPAPTLKPTLKPTLIRPSAPAPQPATRNGLPVPHIPQGDERPKAVVVAPATTVVPSSAAPEQKPTKDIPAFTGEDQIEVMPKKK